MSASALPSRPDIQPCIAIVDDDESVREALGNLLRSVGYGVHAFPTAEAFLDAPESRSVACLVTDVQMPGMDGLELLHRIVESGSDLPVILMTAFPRDHVRRQAEERGVVAILTKPFDAGHLVECIHRAVPSPV